MKLGASLAAAVCALAFAMPAVLAQGTAFTYQGRLSDNNNPANGLYDLRFRLYDAAANGSLIAGPITNSGVTISSGLFTVPLDFGSAFNGGARWLEMGVRPNNAGAFTILSPRQPVTAVPYAATAGQVTAPDVARLNSNQQFTGSNVFSGVSSFTNPANRLVGSFIGNGASLSNLSVAAASVVGSIPASQLSGTLGSAQLSGTYGNALTLNNPANSFNGNGAGLTNLSAWRLGGNPGTTAANFLGTTDNQPLELRVNGLRALRLEPNLNDANESNSVNVVAGSPANFVAPGVRGATIGGGGISYYFGSSSVNTVTNDFGTVSGGRRNTSGYLATVGGGANNTSGGNVSTVGGGEFNTSSGVDSTVGGGNFNTSSGHYSTVGGGAYNASSERFSAVGGGYANTSGGYGATVGGGAGNASSGGLATVGGGDGNSSIGEYATVGGGFANANSGLKAFLGGGNFNVIALNAAHSAIVGGESNAVYSSGDFIGGGAQNYVGGGYGTVSGGSNNSSAGFSATVGGGYFNTSRGDYATVGGGSLNTSFSGYTTVGGGFANTSQGDYATVGGGRQNLSQGDYAAIVGGDSNGNFGTAAFIGGGDYNQIALNADHSAIAGGGASSVWGSYAFVGGGAQNFVAPAAAYSTIGGGFQNSVSGQYSAVLGGHNNSATAPSSFVVGSHGQANHAGAIVLADSTPAAAPTPGKGLLAVKNPEVPPITSTAENQFTARFTGGFRLVTAVDGSTPTAGAELYSGSGSWNALSDRRAKENLREVDSQSVLDQVTALPLSTWNYRTQEKSVRHIGPMAQDFRDAFGLGENDTTISTIDAEGVALAAIQGLNQKVEEENHSLRRELSSRDARLKAQEDRISEVLARLEKIEEKLAQAPASPAEAPYPEGAGAQSAR